MSTAVWIASYPKSGNTWLRFLIAHLIGRSPMASEQLAATIPDAHTISDWAAFKGPKARLIKTHSLPGQLPSELPTAGLIYIVRNPFDVIASNIRYIELCAGEATSALPKHELAQQRALYVERFLRNLGDPNWLQRGFGTYRQHLSEWLGFATASGRPALFCRYEDLHADPEAVVERIAAFLKIEASAAQVERVVQASSFSAMRRIEDQEIAERRSGLFFGRFRQDAHAAGHRFVAKGMATFGRDDFEPAQWLRIAEVFAAEIDRLGYREAVAALMPAMQRSA